VTGLLHGTRIGLWRHRQTRLRERHTLAKKKRRSGNHCHEALVQTGHRHAGHPIRLQHEMQTTRPGL
jgi:hypothetical protein